VKDALNLFQKATQRDPKLAKAYVEQAECFRALGMFGTIPFQQAIDDARKSLSNALSIRDDNAEAHATLSAIEMMEDNVAQGEAEARRAIELNPNLADAYSNLASIMNVRGDLGESIRLREKAYELDPLEPWNMTGLGDEYFWSGRKAEALEIWKISLKFAPYMTFDSMMDYYLKVGDYEKARSTIQILINLEPGNPENDFWEGYLAALQGDRETAIRVINVLEKSAEKGAVTINGEALIYCALGELDRFFELEQQASDSHRLSVSVLRYSPLAARARQDPRTQKLLEKFERKPQAKSGRNAPLS
jgi:pentatricopeptide repeat protein